MEIRSDEEVGDDDAGKDGADGELGELQISGPSAALMYWHNREKTKHTFAGEWTRSGDKYSRDADGYYTVTLTTALLFQPNVTVIDSGGNAFETGVQYNESNKTVKLFMTSRFSGTAYLS